MNTDSDPVAVRFRATLALQRSEFKPSKWRSLWRRTRTALANVWSTTAFEDSKLTEYAQRLMLEETRRGIAMMAALSLLTQIAGLALSARLGAHASMFYTYCLVAALSLHIIVSSRFVSDIRSLYLLGTILLVITGVAIMAIAHRTGTVDAALLTGIVLMFMVMPITPWGLKEAIVIVTLSYLTFTISSMSVVGRFESETLWTLQFLILASATIATLTIMRNVAVRRNDIQARYELETARRKLQLISTRDPLTGAWNRRYLKQNFVKIAAEARAAGLPLCLALLDVDSFKQLNDSHGHHHGDETLRRLVTVFAENLHGTAHIVRLGGDEFAVLDMTHDFEAAIRRCLEHLATEPRLLAIGGCPVHVSVGFAAAQPSETADLDEMYRAADEALYAHKNDK